MEHMATPTRHVSTSGKVTWKVRFRTGGRGSKETSETFVRERDANAFVKLLKQVGGARAREIIEARQAEDVGTYTVASWCTHHIDSLSGDQPDTLDRYRAYVRNDLGPLGPMPLDTVTHEDVAAWVNRLAKAGASGKTIKNKHGFLSAAFGRAEARGLTPSNPCKGARLPRTERPAMVALSQEEYARFIGCFTPHWQPLVVTLFTTGLRWSEATALRVGDLDLDAVDMYGNSAPRLTVTRAWKRDGSVGAPKSEKARRTIALIPEVADILRPLVEGRPGHALVFRNQRGGRVLHQTFHDNVWQPAVRLANGENGQRPGPKAKRVARRRDANGDIIKPLDPPLGKRPRIHDARHSCASWLLAQGVPPTDVQDHLGHESFATTDKLYRHMMPSAPGRVRAALSVTLAPAHPQLEAS